jgi:hypothetical protein
MRLGTVRIVEAFTRRVASAARLAVSFAGALAIGGLLGGCAGSGSDSMAMLTSGGGSGSVAFESVDGPPPQVFDRLVRTIDEEARGRNLSVVARDARATYRVRGYLSAQVRSGRTNIAWVFDVYDANQQRALRINGSEPAGRAGADAWSAADDQVLRRIAQAGVDGLSALVARGPAPAPAPASSAPLVAGGGGLNAGMSVASLANGKPSGGTLGFTAR